MQKMSQNSQKIMTPYCGMQHMCCNTCVATVGKIKKPLKWRGFHLDILVIQKSFITFDELQQS